MGDEPQQDQTPAAAAPNPADAAGRDWTYGICGCCQDVKLCFITYVAPCYTAGKNAEAVGEDCVKHAIFALIPVANILCGAKIREKIREQKGIAGTSANDCIMHLICPLCATIQEAREVADNQVNMAIDRY